MFLWLSSFTRLFNIAALVPTLALKTTSIVDNNNFLRLAFNNHTLSILWLRLVLRLIFDYRYLIFRKQSYCKFTSIRIRVIDNSLSCSCHVIALIFLLKLHVLLCKPIVCLNYIWLVHLFCFCPWNNWSEKTLRSLFTLVQIAILIGFGYILLLLFWSITYKFFCISIGNLLL